MAARPKPDAPLTHPEADALGPVPEDNRPGRRPRRDQDKPKGPPPRPGVAGVRRFPFRFDWLMAPASAAVGVLPLTTWVDVGDEVSIRFGPWSMRFGRDAVVSAEVTGPYALPKVIGPPRLSLADRGVTFATTRTAGVCLRLDEARPAIEPLGVLRHPGVTVTVVEPDELVRLLS